MKRKAIIGGTGIYDLKVEISQTDRVEKQAVETPYGTVNVDILKQEEMPDIVFLPRHGKDHEIPPHMINYRANLKALELLDVDEVLASCMVGSMRSQFGVGEIVTIKDFIDFTKHRPNTFYDDGPVVKHVDMFEPYCQRLRSEFYKAADMKKVRVRGGAVYVCSEGPRFETPAEVKFYQMIGGDVVGMTNVTECVLAKELGMCYAAIGIVSNWATGIGSSVHFKKRAEELEKKRQKVIEVFLEVFRMEAEREAKGEIVRDCHCANSILTV